MLAALLTQIIGDQLNEVDQEFVSENLDKILEFLKSDNGGEIIRLAVSEMRQFVAK